MTLHHDLHGSAGDGEPILFLHGLGTSSWMWDEQVRVLATERLCVTVDLPGCGRSSGIAWTSLADAAERVAEVADTVGSPIHLVGLSLGSYVALRLIADHPAVVSTAVVSGVTTEPLRPRWLWRAGTTALAPLLTTGPVAALSARAMKLSPEASEQYRRDTTALRSHTIRRVYDEVVDFRPPFELGDRDHPVLAVAGGREADAVLRGLHALPALMPHAAAAIAPGLHHGWNGEDPDLFTAMVRSWVEDGDLSAGLDPVAAPRFRPAT